MNNEIKLIAKFKETLVEKEKELEKFRKWQQDAAQSLYDKDKEIERLNNIINRIKELCENQFIDYRVDSLGNAKKNYAPINTNEIMEIINEEF